MHVSNNIINLAELRFSDSGFSMSAAALIFPVWLDGGLEHDFRLKVRSQS